MKEHYKQIAQRIGDADKSLVDTLAKFGNISHDDAAKVAKYYVKHKLVKLDAYHARYQYKHGALLDADVIARALTL